LTDFDEIWQDDAYWSCTAERPLKFRIFENSTWRQHHLENHKNRDISATVRPIITKFGTLMQNVSLNPPRLLKKLNFTNPRWRTAAILRTVTSYYLSNLLTDFDEIWHGDACWSPEPCVNFKFLIFDNLIRQIAAI